MSQDDNYSRRDFLRGGFLRRPQQEQQTSKEQEKTTEPNREFIPYEKPGHDDVENAAERARAMIGIVKPPEEKPLDVGALLSFLADDNDLDNDELSTTSESDTPKIAKLYKHLCLAYNGSFCSTCKERCPEEQAISIDAGRPTIHPQYCTGCWVCVQVCPAPTLAIAMVNHHE